MSNDPAADAARIAVQAQHPTAAGMVGDSAATAAKADAYECEPSTGARRAERTSFWQKVMLAIGGTV